MNHNAPRKGASTLMEILIQGHQKIEITLILADLFIIQASQHIKSTHWMKRGLMNSAIPNVRRVIPLSTKGFQAVCMSTFSMGRAGI